MGSDEEAPRSRREAPAEWPVMAGYSISVSRSAQRELGSLQARVVERIAERIDALGSQPRPPGCRKLSGTADVWRIRVGDYRILYTVDDRHRIVDISAVRHRRDAYR